MLNEVHYFFNTARRDNPGNAGRANVKLPPLPTSNALTSTVAAVSKKPVKDSKRKVTLNSAQSPVSRNANFENVSFYHTSFFYLI